VVKPCCAFSPHAEKSLWPKLQEKSLEEIWNSDAQKQLRKDFLENKRPDGCELCWNKEDSGLHSFRLALNDRYKKYIESSKLGTENDGTYKNFNLIYWDFRFSNICNFKCRMCGHDLSSSWWDDLSYKKNKPKFLDSNYYGQDLMKYVDQFIDCVEEIYFAGGEPLIMNEHYRILDKLIEKKKFDVYLRYNTNLSTLKYKNYDLIEIWKKFKKIDMFVSIDGEGKIGEYIRKGSDWKKIENNLQILMQNEILNPEFKIYICVTVQILNVFHIKNLIDKIISLNIDPRRIIITNLSWPEEYKVSLLSDELKDQLKEIFEKHLEVISPEYVDYIRKIYSSIIYNLNQTSDAKQVIRFIKNNEKIDKIRNEDVKSIVPELKQWIEDRELGSRKSTSASPDIKLQNRDPTKRYFGIKKSY
jgi:pyruvate-formate lyase-activating enzyme